MRDFLVQHIPDPGAVIFVLIGGLIFFVLFRMLTDNRPCGQPVEHDTTPRAPIAPIDPEADARTRGF